MCVQNHAMQLTREYIMKHRTARGAWTRAQIEALGLEWPPRKGWIDTVIGRELTEAQARQFQNTTTKKQAKAVSPDQMPLF